MNRIYWSRFFRRLVGSLGAGTSRRRTALRGRPRGGRPVKPVLQLESLEDRTLLSSYTVTVGGDALNPDGSPVAGTLRWAVTQADVNPNSTITFDTTKLFGAGKSGTIALANGELPVKVNMTIEGASNNSVVTISGAGGKTNPSGKKGTSRVFDITSSAATVTISNLTIKDGNASPFNTTVSGNQGGDIFNGGNLTLTNDIVTQGNSAGYIGGFNGRGGAIYNAEGTNGPGAILILDGTTVENSFAVGVSGGEGQGGGVFNDSNATLILQNGSHIVDNQALGGVGGPGLGGGIYSNTGAKLQLNGNSTSSIVIEDNLAQGQVGFSGGNGGGGGAARRGPHGGAGSGGGGAGFAQGGGIFNTGSSFTLQYVNILGNQAVGGRGGNGGAGGVGGTGTDATLGTGGTGGTGGGAGFGGSAQGGGIYNGIGTLSMSHILFGVDANNRGNQALGGSAGTAGVGGGGGGNVTFGGEGGIGGGGSNGGFAKGGAIANDGGNLSFSDTTFTSSLAQGGDGSSGGVAGNGSAAKGKGDRGGAAGNAVAGGAGGLAQGGAISNQAGNLSILSSNFSGNVVVGGNGGGGGAGGVGGTGGPPNPVVAGPGGPGGSGASGGVGGNAQGGGFYNLIGTVTINGSEFTATSKGIGNQAISGNGGNGGHGGTGGQGGDTTSGIGGPGGAAGVGGNAGNSGFAEGGVGGNQGGNTFVTSSIFKSSLVRSGNGGQGGNGGTGGAGGNGAGGPIPPYNDGFGGAGGNAGAGGASEQAFGGVIAVTASNLTVTGSTFGANGAGNTVVGGKGGAGGIGGTIGTWGHAANLNEYALVQGIDTGNGSQAGAGAAVNGGALSATGFAVTIQIDGSSFTSNSIAGGTGGAGGAGGVFSVNGVLNGFNGQGGAGGIAQGGGVFLSSTTAESATLSNDTITANSATGGLGGAGNINNGEGGGDPSLPGVSQIGMPSPPGTLIAEGANGFGSNGGAGGSVEGVGLADVNYNLNINSSSFNAGTGLAGVGGPGGGADGTEPYTFIGGAGGAGGAMLGGGVFFSNSSSGTLSFTYNGGTAAGNTITGGVGGQGGNAGASGHSNITGGFGGQGGNTQGGGIYLFATTSSINKSSLANLTLADNAMIGGTGGNGGAGFNATGGAGGDAQGGAFYNTSLNTAIGQNSSVAIAASTVSGNHVTGGYGGDAGSSTTPNGGAGGVGGDAGLGEGAGLYNGENTPLTVINSTFGGGSTSSSAAANYNQLFGGRGGTGGNAGTATGVPNNNGGPGGGGGNISGANAYIAGNSATFINDTIVYGQATVIGVGGAGGSGAGSGGLHGPAGSDGTAIAGGYFAASGSKDILGNTILAANNAATDPDAAGAFTSAGNNLLSSIAGATGFNTGVGGTDQIVTPGQLNLGPLMNNGGPTSTDALLKNVNGKSAAIDAGNNALISTYGALFGVNPTDQRGTGFPRIYPPVNGTVDVGAFEYQLPVINNLNPPSAVEQGSPFTLTITGTGFITGAVVNWDFNGSLSSYSNLDNLTPLSVSANQITVAIPANAMPDEGTANVTVTVPDGSNIAGETLTSTPVVFTITEGSSVTLSNPGPEINNEGDTISVANGNAVQITSSDPDTTFNDVVNGQDSLPTGLTIDPTTGLITGTIGLRAANVYNVTINGIDDGVIQGTSTFTWTVNDTTPPGFTNPGTQNNNEGALITGLATSPVDADPDSITATGLPQGLSIDSTTGVISGTIYAYAANNSPYTVIVSATDGKLPNGNPNIGTMQFQWNVADTTAPTLSNPGDQTSGEGASPTLQIELAPGDIDPPDSFKALGLPQGLTINNSGLISGTLGMRAAGTYPVTITATDNGYVSKAINFTWTVLDTTPPGFTIGDQTNNEGQQNISVATTPVDADPGSITDVVSGQHTLPPGLSIDPSSGLITGNIGTYAAGSFNVTISATDGTLPDGKPNIGTAQFTWTVLDTSPPSFTIGNQTSNEAQRNISVSTNPVDADPGSITDVVNGQHSLPPGLTIDPISGLITGNIGAYAAGTYNVTISATDGTLPNGTTNTGTVKFTWTVNDITPPSFTIGDQTSNEGDQNISVATTPVDADPGSITDVVNGQHTLPPGLSIDPTSGIITGNIGPYAAGTYTVTLSAQDGTLPNGNPNLGTATFTWKVNDTTPPNFSVSNQNNNEGDSVNYATDPVDADPGSITATGLPPGLSINANTGVISGTIDPRGAGSYNVTLSATDGTLPNGTANTGTSTFTWTVNDTTPPVLTNPGNQVSNQATTATVAIQAVDADSFSVSGLPAGLSINPATGVISGTVFSGAGTYRVTVSAFDDNAVSRTTFAWVVNQAPIAVAVTNVQNVYVGFYQVETVTAQVTNPVGIPVNRGVVTFQVNGETLTAPVSNGFATVTFATPMLSLDMTILFNDVFTHSLNAVFSDSASVFGSGSSSLTEPAMFLDYLLYLQALEFGPLGLQLTQLQPH